MRIETDSLGERELPEHSYFGIQTQRAIENFEISGITTRDFPSFIRAMATIKKASALANRDGGRLTEDQCNAICLSADDILDGKMEKEFPIDIFQGGGGTSNNMNANEVIANRANEILTGTKNYSIVHPNTHVNMGQSTNDVIPAAMKMSIYEELGELEKSLVYACNALKKKEKEFKDVIKLGRTCLQDAIPTTLGNMFSGYRSCLERQMQQISKIKKHLKYLPLPATAIGNCFGASPDFEKSLYTYLQDISAIKYKREKNLYDALQNADIWVQVSASLKSLASFFGKLSSDFRIMSSGPRAGIGEITLPVAQPGSSIMPGKVNPVMPEMMIQVSFKVMGNDLTVSLAAERGELELNVWESIILQCITESIKLLKNSIRLFTDKCIANIKANKEKCYQDAHASLALSTVLAVLFDYPTASKVAKQAEAQGCSIQEAAVDQGLISKEKAQMLLDPANLLNINQFEKVLLLSKGIVT
jgi:aspartate ammonia-lyase